MSTRQMIKRFLEPLLGYKKNVLFAILLFILWSAYYAVGILFVRRVTQSIELKDTTQLYYLL